MTDDEPDRCVGWRGGFHADGSRNASVALAAIVGGGADSSGNAVTTKTNNTVKFNTISNLAVTNTTGDSPTCGYQAGIADVGHKDLIVNNAISGFGYTPTVGGDCTGVTPAFLRFIDLDSSTRGAPSNK